MNTTSEGVVADPRDAAVEANEALPESSEPSVGTLARETTLDRFGPLALVVLVAVVFFTLLPPLSTVGMWDPYELNIADLARRIAVHLHGAPNLALDGAENSLPHLNDLGRPQLPFTSIALGFKLFGLREWAGRLPLALWGLIGVVSTYGFVSRLSDRRTGVYAALALTAMPIYFVQSRTMIGDVTTMASLAMAVGGFAVALFDSRATMTARGAWLALAMLGLAGGWLSRGGMIGLGVPLLTVAFAAAAVWGMGDREKPAIWQIVVAVVALVAGVEATRRGVIGTFTTAPDTTNLNLWVGAMIRQPGKYPTFDFLIAQLGHGLAPWSAFLPFAMGRLFAMRREDTAYQNRYATLGTVLLVGASVCFAAQGFLAARTEPISFAATPLLAAICGLAIRDFERDASLVPPVAVGVGTAVFLGVFHHDFHSTPEKSYQAFGMALTTFPESFKERSLAIWTVVLVGLAAVALVTWLEDRAEREPFLPKSYVVVVRVLGEAYDGMLALAYFAVVAGASLAALGVWAGTRWHMTWLPQMGGPLRDGLLNAWWILAFGPLGGLFSLLFLSDLWLWAFTPGRSFGKSSWSRGFEPFEMILDRVRQTESPARAFLGLVVAVTRTTEDDDKREPIVTDSRVGWFVLVPLVFLAVPVAVALGCHKVWDLRWPVCVALALPSGLLAFTIFGLLADAVRGRRAGFFLVASVMGGALLCGRYYPELANQLSPKEVFGSFLRVKKSGDQLGLFGVGGRTSAYYAGGDTPIFHDSDSAYQWLSGASASGIDSPSASLRSGRRFIALNAGELPRLNHLYRQKTHRNIPVVDARSSQIMLVASSLTNDERSENPIDQIVLTTQAKPQHALTVSFEDRLEMFGYDITDSTGKLVDAVSTGRKFHIKSYFRVTAPMQGREWKIFIHIDGYRRRHNGDHPAMGGKYPVAYWDVGDVLIDDYEFTLEPNFAAGTYAIFLGLFDGETRMKVVSGPNDNDNRVNAGNLAVR